MSRQSFRDHLLAGEFCCVRNVKSGHSFCFFRFRNVFFLFFRERFIFLSFGSCFFCFRFSNDFRAMNRLYFTFVCFSVFVSLALARCPNQCSGHGVCDSASFRCACDSYYQGRDCGVYNRSLTNGTSASAIVGTSQWMFFSINGTTSNNTFVWSLNQTKEGDCDLYVQRNEFPTRFSYIERDISTKNESKIELYNQTAGVYYAGVYGFQKCNFTIVAMNSTSNVSSNVTMEPTNNTQSSNCSFHGEFVNTTCNCSAGFNGTQCEEYMPALPLNTTMSGYVGENFWNYYHVDTRGFKSLNVSLNQTGNSSSSGDCDLYVSHGQKPSLFQYQFSNVSMDQRLDLIIPETNNQTWYIGVYGWSNCSYTLNVSVPRHEKVLPTNLTSGQPLALNVSRNEWQNFSIDVEHLKALSLTLKESATVGAVSVFVKFGELPTLQSHDYSNQLTSSGHQIRVLDREGYTGTVYVGVLGSPSIPFFSSVDYKLRVSVK